MTVAGTIVTIAIILLWTGVRETLLDKYAHAKHPHCDRNSGLIVLGCFVATLGLLAIIG